MYYCVLTELVYFCSIGVVAIVHVCMLCNLTVCLHVYFCMKERLLAECKSLNEKSINLNVIVMLSIPKISLEMLPKAVGQLM